jgi:chorismate dehydratase
MRAACIVQCGLDPGHSTKKKLRVCAVSYLNTVPLVWGMLHGSQRDLFDLEFCIPSECADRLAGGMADIGIAPSVELLRQNLELIPGAGIASHGAVRSILLVSKKPQGEIRVLAADSSSRTSVVLARIVLARRYGAEPLVVPMPPDAPSMLEAADAALIIGDPALRLDTGRLPYTVTDLGEEWAAMTGLPMVFAVWAGRRECVTAELRRPFLESCRFGLANIEEIVRREAEVRSVPQALAREYLTRQVRLELGEREYEGLRLFLQYAEEFAAIEPPGRVSA